MVTAGWRGGIERRGLGRQRTRHVVGATHSQAGAREDVHPLGTNNRVRLHPGGLQAAAAAGDLVTFSAAGWKTIKMEAAVRPEGYGMASWAVTVTEGGARAAALRFMEGGNTRGNGLLRFQATATALTSVSAVQKHQQLFLLRQLQHLVE